MDKFRRYFIIKFYGACTIRNHVMLVTEFPPCGSFMDCIKKPFEPSEVKTKLMLDPFKGLARLRDNNIQLWDNIQTRPLSSRWMRCLT